MSATAAAGTSRAFRTTALCLYSLGTVAAGLLDLIWRDFEVVHQPIVALGDHIPARTLLACATAVWMIVAGLAILLPRTARAGAAATAVIYAVFAAFWLPRFITAPHALGFRLSLIVGLLAGIFTQLIAVGGGVVHYLSLSSASSSRKSGVFARYVFGVGSILFGLAHLTGVKLVARMIPTYMPFAGFWVVVSGIAFIMAGIAIVGRIFDTLAALLLGLMLLLFEPFVLLPNLIMNWHNHIAWGANAYNLAAAGAVWIFAKSLSDEHRMQNN